jgi:hypothetical protein
LVTAVQVALVFQYAPGAEVTRAGWTKVVPPLPPVPPPAPPPPVVPPVLPPEQAPFAQVCPAAQAVQLDPQWAESVLELQALSPHFVLPEPHDVEHWPLLHTPPAGQTVQLVPQCSVFEATQAPPHETSPGAQAHAPAWQEVFIAHAFPQAPQFSSSL